MSRPRTSLKQRPKRGCANDTEEPRDVSLAALVRAYVDRVRPRKRDYLHYYASLPSLEEAVRVAAAAQAPNGKRHSHQSRISSAALAKAGKALDHDALRSCSSFHDLMQELERSIGVIKGIGPLMIYDTALRLGAYMYLSPDHVYLHAGTRKGARALGLPTRGRDFLDVEEVPNELRNIDPWEIEDFLCIYKDRLGY